MSPAINTGKRTYYLPAHFLRLVIPKLIECAPSCGSEPMAETRDTSVGDRCRDAVAFMARALAVDTDEDLERVIEEECVRFGKGEEGAREVYMNVVTLQSHMDSFFGPLSAKFLCEEHMDIAEEQSRLAAEYAELDHGQITEGDPHVRITETQLNAAAVFGKPNITRQ